jgi:hypothetical protein
MSLAAGSAVHSTSRAAMSPLPRDASVAAACSGVHSTSVVLACTNAPVWRQGTGTLRRSLVGAFGVLASNARTHLEEVVCHVEATGEDGHVQRGPQVVVAAVHQQGLGRQQRLHLERVRRE